MANPIRLKRRATGGAAGAPASLLTTEPAYNEVDDVLYLGKGDDGSANATSIIPIAGKGAFVDLTSSQTVSGAKTFSTSPTVPTPTAGDNTTKVATTAFVQNAVTSTSDGNQSANTVKAGPVSGGAATPTYRALVADDIPSLSNTKITDFATGVTDAITPLLGANSGIATLDSTGKVPSTQLPSYVDDVVEVTNFAALPGTGASGIIYVTINDNKTYRWAGSNYTEISASPGSTDAVPEGTTNKYFTESRVLATVLTGLSTATNAAIAATDSILVALGKLQAQINARLIASNNLSDLTNVSTARTNLGLGSMATQDASNVSITGGTIDNVVIYGGTF